VQLHTCFRPQRQAIEFLVDWTRRQPDVELVIRLHPKGKPHSDPHYWDSLQGQGVTVDAPDSETDSYALAESADLVLTHGSTMGLEAAFAGKPVVLLCDSAYRGLNCVYEPKTQDQVVALLGQRGCLSRPKIASPMAASK
jgi:UDP-N-acetylglucosamine 2-epimerase